MNIHIHSKAIALKIDNYIYSLKKNGIEKEFRISYSEDVNPSNKVT